MKSNNTLEQKQACESVINNALSSNIRLKKESIDAFNRKPYYMMNTYQNTKK